MLSRLRFTLLLPSCCACRLCDLRHAHCRRGHLLHPHRWRLRLHRGRRNRGRKLLHGQHRRLGIRSFSGVFRYTNPGTVCVSGAQDISFTGTFANSTLTLTSGSFSNSVATLTVQLPLITNNIGAQVTSGTAVIAGGTCALASTSLQATLYPSFAGAWTIALTSPTALTESLTVTQSATADADGQFIASGTLNSGSGTISLTGVVSGPYLNLANLGSTVTVSANETATPVTFSV